MYEYPEQRSQSSQANQDRRRLVFLPCRIDGDILLPSGYTGFQDLLLSDDWRRLRDRESLEQPALCGIRWVSIGKLRGRGRHQLLKDSTMRPTAHLPGDESQLR